MKPDELKLTNFRCFGHDEATVSFENGGAAFVGGKASGKPQFSKGAVTCMRIVHRGQSGIG